MVGRSTSGSDRSIGWNSLYILFLQPEPIILEEPFFWDPEPAWQFPADLNLELLQGYVVQDYAAHYTEEDLVQEEPRVLGECFLPSTVNSLINSVSDSEYDPIFYIIDERLPHPNVPYSKDGDCSVMVLQTTPLDDLWGVDEIVDVGKASPPANL